MLLEEAAGSSIIPDHARNLRPGAHSSANCTTPMMLLYSLTLQNLLYRLSQTCTDFGMTIDVWKIVLKSLGAPHPPTHFHQRLTVRCCEHVLLPGICCQRFWQPKRWNQPLNRVSFDQFRAPYLSSLEKSPTYYRSPSQDLFRLSPEFPIIQ